MSSSQRLGARRFAPAVVETERGVGCLPVHHRAALVRKVWVYIYIYIYIYIYTPAVVETESGVRVARGGSLAIHHRADPLVPSRTNYLPRPRHEYVLMG